MLNEGELGGKGFVKQRRNLLIFSFALAAVEFLDIRYPGRVQLAGNTWIIGNPDGIELVLWGVWLYFLIRYVAFHLQYQPGSERFLPYFRERKRERRAYAARRAAIAQGLLVEPSKTNYQFSPLERNGLITYKSVAFIGPRDYPEQKLEINNIPASRVWLADCRALGRTLFGYAPTSEYYLPYVVAALPWLPKCIGL